MESTKSIMQADLSESLKKEPRPNTVTCKKHGTQQGAILTPLEKMFIRYDICKQCAEEEHEKFMAEEEAKQEKKRASRKEQILSGNLMSIPIRFKKAMIEHFESPYDFDLQSSVLITGACGTGKTHLAVALAKQAFLSLNDSNSVFPDNHFYNFQEIIIKVKSSFRDSSESMDKIIAPLLKGFRIIDDIGASKPTDTTIETLYTIVNKRYEDELATIYTTNLSLAEISNVYGDRIASRLSDCRRIVLTGNDRRLKGSNG